MSDTDANKATEILLLLATTEKRGLNLYNPLKQIEGILHDLQDDNLLILHQRLMAGFKALTTNEQSWADDYFTFNLLLCNLINNTGMNVNQDSLTDKATSNLVPA